MAAPVAVYKAARMARRVAPVAAEAYRRWNALSPEEKERYKQRARGYAQRGQEIGRDAIARAQHARAQQQKRKKR
jgi:hypothetical protein